MNRLLLLLTLGSASAQPLRVMSFNVRYPNPEDGANAWEKRRDLLVEVVRQHDPDVMGTQELFKLQGDYIVARLPEYAWFGSSRRGNDQDEHMGVFYRKDRLKLEESGQFWLSTTPSAPGSQSWGMTLPRMATWGLFRTKAGQRFYLLNTHFAHRREDDEARLKGAGVILEQIQSLKPHPVIVTGDFNSPAGGEVHARFLQAGFADAREQAALISGPEGTFHGFRGDPGPARIDWILTRGVARVLRTETVTDHRTLYPSDHFPVQTVLQLR